VPPSRLPAQRLKPCIDEQVLRLDLGQIAGDEGQVVLPEPVGDLADFAIGDQQLTGRVAEGVLHIAGRQPARVHLVDQRLEHLAVAFQETHQPRPERLTRTAYLRNCHVDEAFGSTQPAPRSRCAAQLVIAAVLVTAASTEEVALLTLQQLLHHQPRHRLHQRGDDVAFLTHAAAEQPLQLLTRENGWGYPSHRPAPSIVGPTHPT
jgi:hypothetical protein